MHRTKIGYKRILISYSNTHTQNPLLLRSKVFNLLSEVPGGRLQLFKFREMFEKRYHSSIGVSDLYKMKEIVHISEDGSSNSSSGRMVQLHATLLAQHPQQQVHLQLQQMPSYQGQSFCGGASRSASSSSTAMLPATSSAAGSLDLLEASQCVKHAPQSEKDKVVKVHQEHNSERDGYLHLIQVGWAEKENGSSLPLVNISLQIFGPMLRKVIKVRGKSTFKCIKCLCYVHIFFRATE